GGWWRMAVGCSLVAVRRSLIKPELLAQIHVVGIGDASGDVSFEAVVEVHRAPTNLPKMVGLTDRIEFRPALPFLVDTFLNDIGLHIVGLVLEHAQSGEPAKRAVGHGARGILQANRLWSIAGRFGSLGGDSDGRGPGDGGAERQEKPSYHWNGI